MTKNARDFENFHLQSNREQCLMKNPVHLFGIQRNARVFTDKEGV